MNHWSGTGRVTRDIELKTTAGENPTSVARFTTACNRRFKKEGQPDADFISCIAFGKTAEWLSNYIHKGMKVEIEGHIQTGSYEKDGVKHYTTDVIVETADFAESKKAQGETVEDTPAETPDDDGFVSVPDGLDEELPFA